MFKSEERRISSHGTPCGIATASSTSMHGVELWVDIVAWENGETVLEAGLSSVLPIPFPINASFALLCYAFQYFG